MTELSDETFLYHFEALKDRFGKRMGPEATAEWLELLLEEGVQDQEFIEVSRHYFRGEYREFPLPCEFIDRIRRLRAPRLQPESIAQPEASLPKFSQMSEQQKQETIAAIERGKQIIAAMNRRKKFGALQGLGEMLPVPVAARAETLPLEEIFQRQYRLLRGDDHILAKAALEWAHQHPDIEVFLNEETKKPDIRIKQNQECA